MKISLGILWFLSFAILPSTVRSQNSIPIPPDLDPFSYTGVQGEAAELSAPPVLVNPLTAPLDFACFRSGAPDFNFKATQFVPENAYWLALMSWLVYFPQNQAMMLLHENKFKKASFIYAQKDDSKKKQKQYRKIIADTEALWAETDDYAILVFRGTETVTNIDIKTDLLGFKHRMGKLGKVHIGFYGALTIVWRQVIENIRAMNKPKPIFVTGHSLGGALALLSGVKLIATEVDWKGPTSKLNESDPDDENDVELPIATKDNAYWVQGLYTFGAPAVGNGEFVDNAESLFELAKGWTAPDQSMPGFGSARVINARDPVPMLSPRLMGYRKTDDMILFDTKGRMHTGLAALKKAPRSILRVLAPFKKMSAAHALNLYLLNISKNLGMDKSHCMMNITDAKKN